MDNSIQKMTDSSYEDPMEKMEEELKCTICRRLLEEPLLLRCSHNFCKDCVERLAQRNLHNGQAWRLPSVMCPLCGQEQLTMGIYQPMNNNSLKAVVNIFKSIKAVLKCKVHAGQPLNMFCSTDHVLICGVCATSREHRNHTFSSVDEAYREERNLFQDLILKLENRRDVASQLKILETNKKKDLQLLSVQSEKVKDCFERLQYGLELEKTRIRSEIESKKEVVTQMFYPHLDKLATRQEALKKVQDCKDISDPLPFIQKMEKLREKFGSIDLSVPDAPVFPAKKRFDPIRWNEMKLSDVSRNLPGKGYKEKPGIRIAFVGLLLFTVMAAMFYAMTLSHQHHVTFCDYVRPVKTYLSDSIGTATEYISSLLWNKGPEEILYLDMDEAATPVTPTAETTSDLMVISQSRDLETTNTAEYHLDVQQYVHSAASYISTVIVKTAQNIACYWWWIVEETSGLWKRCPVYVMAFVGYEAGNY